MYCGWWLPGTPSMPVPGMFVQMMEYRQPVFFSICGEVPRLPAGRLGAADDPPQPVRPVPRAAHQVRDLRDVLVFLDRAVLGDAGLPRARGHHLDGILVGRVIIHPQVNSTIRRGEDIASRCLIELVARAGPVDADQQLATANRAGTCRIAAASTSRWSANVFDPALPGRLGRVGAPCRDCSRWVSPTPPPHPACDSHRTGRSLCLDRWISRWGRLMAGGRGWGSASRGSGSGPPARSPRR